MPRHNACAGDVLAPTVVARLQVDGERPARLGGVIRAAAVHGAAVVKTDLAPPHPGRAYLDRMPLAHRGRQPRGRTPMLGGAESIS